MKNAPLQKKTGVVRASCAQARARASAPWRRCGATIGPMAMAITGTVSAAPT
jgi:hypothetical protein